MALITKLNFITNLNYVLSVHKLRQKRIHLINHGVDFTNKFQSKYIRLNFFIIELKQNQIQKLLTKNLCPF
jgi:hypothetical protein